MTSKPGNMGTHEAPTVKAIPRVVFIVVAISTGLLAIVAVGFGVFGAVPALSTSDGGFVGEKYFYASAVFCVSLIVIAVGAVSGIVSYIFWSLWSRRQA